MPEYNLEIEATYDKVNGPLMLTWTIAKQFSRLAADHGRDRAELYLEKALENLVKVNLDKFSTDLLDDYNGAAKWLGVLDSGDPLEGAARAMNDKLCEAQAEVGECIKLVEHATNRADSLAVAVAAVQHVLNVWKIDQHPYMTEEVSQLIGETQLAITGRELPPLADLLLSASEYARNPQQFNLDVLCEAAIAYAAQSGKYSPHA